ncbi:MAG: hypothetical protein HFF17_08925 [Oscillospiraceae bacterium]|nr:hypothetical protein [Oscillospiraceae bacterium]
MRLVVFIVHTSLLIFSFFFLFRSGQRRTPIILAPADISVNVHPIQNLPAAVKGFENVQQNPKYK